MTTDGVARAPRIDAHVRLGASREATLSPDALLAAMQELGVDVAVVAPWEAAIAVDEREGNRATTALASQSGGRILAWAVANPWRGRAALDELSRARDEGAAGFAVDAALQGFDLLDGQLDPLLERCAEWGWPVYVRTGTPPSAVPMPLALLARRHADVSIVMGRSGATDFWIDAVPALCHAENLYADTCYAPWDTVLTSFSGHPEVGAGRVVFSTDAPYAVPGVELQRVLDWPLSEADRALVLGGTMQRLLSGSSGCVGGR